MSYLVTWKTLLPVCPADGDLSQHTYECISREEALKIVQELREGKNNTQVRIWRLDA